jgi:hypothetical protein
LLTLKDPSYNPVAELTTDLEHLVLKPAEITACAGDLDFSFAGAEELGQRAGGRGAGVEGVRG